MPAELHLVHKASDGALAVVGVLYEYGSADPIVNKVRSCLLFRILPVGLLELLFFLASYHLVGKNPCAAEEISMPYHILT